MKKEIKSLLKKTVKIAGAACIAAGAVAIVASGTALKAVTQGGAYLAATVKKIAGEQNQSLQAAANTDSPETEC